jgi:hypothetical protein
VSKNTDHVKVRNTESGAYEMICEHCGLRGVITPPVPMDNFIKMLEKFGKDHAHCLPYVKVESNTEELSDAHP